MDPGVDPLEGHGPPTQALFSENLCKNERVGSHRGVVCWAHPLDPPMLKVVKKMAQYVEWITYDIPICFTSQYQPEFH